VKLSLRVWLVICGLVLAFRVHRVSAEAVPLAPTMFSEEWVQALERRIERLLPPLLSSLAAVRRQHDAGLVRCFDRAVAGLNSVQRQVSYHADLRYEAGSEAERVRHTRALALLSARAEELGRSVETCFTDGVPVKRGETVVEVTIERL
jgi:hypothetical protein